MVLGASIQLCMAVGRETPKQQKSSTCSSETPSKNRVASSTGEKLRTLLTVARNHLPCSPSANKPLLPTSPIMPGARISGLDACTGSKPHLPLWKLTHKFPTRKRHHPLHSFPRTKQMELSFHLLDVPLPHMPPTFMICIYITGNPAWARLTSSRWILSKHTSRVPCSAWTQTTQNRQHNWHPDFYCSPFIPREVLLSILTLSKIRVHQTEIYLFFMAQEASKPSFIALRADKTGFWSPLRLLSGCQRVHRQLLTGLSEPLFIPAFLFNCFGSA